MAVDKVSKYKADYKIDPADCSLYVMKAGCQEDFLHRVRRDKKSDHGESVFLSGVLSQRQTLNLMIWSQVLLPL